MAHISKEKHIVIAVYIIIGSVLIHYSPFDKVAMGCILFLIWLALSPLIDKHLARKPKR